MKATRKEMKEQALLMMERMEMSELLIEELHETENIRMSEQWIKDAPYVIPGQCQARTYFDLQGNMYDVYPYVAGMPVCDGARKKFERETGYFVYHMHYMVTLLGPQLSLMYVPGDNELWEDLLEDAADGRIDCQIINLESDDVEYGVCRFCATDNGCLMRLA